jgi:ComF family protein
MMSIPNSLQSFFQEALHLAYPNICICCHKLLGENEEDICQACYEGFDAFEQPLEAHQHIMATLDKNFPDESILKHTTACYRFHKSSLLARAIHAFKYKGYQNLAVQFGRHLAHTIKRDIPFQDVDLIIPIPLHRVKLIERTYNQALCLSRGINQELKIPVEPDGLRKTSYTQSQTTFIAAERKENLKHVFSCVKNLKGLHVLLVDDLFTTGATLLSAATILKQAGAREVSATALAIADT